MEALAKAVVMNDGAARLNGLAGVLIAVYLAFMGLQSLLLSFRYAVYSMAAAGAILVAELPAIFNCGPLAYASKIVTPAVKVLIYGALCLGGLVCFINYSWNPFLLAGHLAVGGLAYRTWSENKGAAPHGYDQVSMDCP
mmetsp:Transcript_28214/g.65236  ORF Transcript_28214/g.65236 Transcript_28214/m.65236 type:complete len:139 (-) Transcript_28214:34-450(-)